jgi:hypothetical protein
MSQSTLKVLSQPEIGAADLLHALLREGARRARFAWTSGRAACPDLEGGGLRWSPAIRAISFRVTLVCWSTSAVNGDVSPPNALSAVWRSATVYRNAPPVYGIDTWQRFMYVS